MNFQLTHQEQFREDISEYVAQLQLHMALQARNFLPSLTDVTTSREKMYFCNIKFGPLPLLSHVDRMLPSLILMIPFDIAHRE